MLYASAYNSKALDPSIAKYKVPKREDVVYWEGVAHQDLIKMVRKVAKERKLKITGEHFQLGNSGHTLFGSWDFNRQVPGVKGMTMSLGYRGSNMSRYAHTFVVGARIFICSNGMISGEFGYKRKHSKEVDLYELVTAAFDRYLEEIKNIRPLVSSLQSKKMSGAAAAEIMLESCRRGIVAWSRIRIVDAQWNKPEHRQFSARTGWSLYNAFTQSAKKTSPRSQMEIMRDLPNLILGKDSKN